MKDPNTNGALRYSNIQYKSGVQNQSDESAQLLYICLT